MRAEKSRPAGDRAAEVNHSGGGSTAVILPENVPEFAAMTPRGRFVAGEYWSAGCEFGYASGYAAGYEAAEAAQAELERRAFSGVSAAVKHPDFATLCERRGEPERAERQRRTLVARGIDPPIKCGVCGTPTSPWTCSCGATRQEVA